jgi:hypothetical protein
VSSGKSFPLDAASQHAMSTMRDLDMDEVHLGQLIILAIGLFLVGSGRAPLPRLLLRRWLRTTQLRPSIMFGT